MPFLAPIAAAVVGAIGAAVTTVATTVSAIAANAALAAGLSAATVDAVSAGAFALVSTGIEVGALMGASALLKPHLDVGGGGMQTAFKADPQSGVPYVLGRTGTGGNIVFSAVAGPKNQDLTYVAVLSAGGPIEAIESFSVDGTTVAFDGAGACTTAPFNLSHMWQKTQLGAAGASALTISGPTIPPEWGSAEKLSGKAAAIWTLRYDAKVYPVGTPKALWVLKGAKVYDPRLDSTYPGGSGAQRLATPSTWTWSENPFLHALAWTLGVYENGKRIMGVGAPWAAIDVANFVEGANVADVNAFKVGGVIYSTDDKWAVLTAILQAGAASPLKLGAKISCFVQMPRVSLATLTASEVQGEVSIQATQSRRTRINKIWPRYREETAGWELTPTKDPVAVSLYATEDGEERSRQIDYQLVQDAALVAVMARYNIEDSREFGPLVFPCKPRWMGYRPGDCITVNEPEFGLNGQLVLIVDRSIDPATMTATLTCRSETFAKHAFALGQTGDPPPTPGLTGFDPSLIGAPGGSAWNMTGSSFVGAGELPCLIIDGAVDNPNVTDIIVDWRERLTPTPTWGDWATVTFPASAERLVVAGVKDSAYYGAQVRYRTQRGVEDFAQALDLGVVQVGEIHISDEGLLAGLDHIEDEQLAAGVGVNCLVDTQFTQGSNWWRPNGDSSVTGTYPVSANGVCWAKVVNTGGAVGQEVRLDSDNQVNSLPIKPGDYIECQAVVGGQGVGSIFIQARWLDASGANIGGTPLADTLQTITSYGGGGGEIDSGNRIGGFARAPAGAYRVMLQIIGIIAAGGSGNDWIFVTQPMLAKAKDGSSVLSQFNQGFLGEPGATVGAKAGTNLKNSSGSVLDDADVVTSLGTSADFTGSTPWARYAQYDPNYNLNQGHAGTRTVTAVLSAPAHNQIDVAAHSIYYGNQSGTVGAASITGLTASTFYNVFLNAHTGALVAVSGDGQSYFDDPTTNTWIWLGGQATPAGDDVTFPALVTTPPGGGGAIASWAAPGYAAAYHL